MAKHTLGNSNQKRYFAKFYLDAIGQIQADNSVFNKKALIRAHQESCLFHLVMAYQSFIWEIANTYDEDYVSGTTLKQLLESSKENGKTIAELERLYTLETQKGSWLFALLDSWNRIADVNPQATSTVKSSTNLNAIEVRVFNEADELSQLHDWYDNLCILIDEIREMLGEW
ncbi:MAG: hypothetical protein D6160_03640 [Ketobacter sp.]|nr:MAG: hypothetical protein D6160_03640 [Ketobacter sp.]